MTLPSPNLDDRDFQTLVQEARRVIAQRCPDWTDLSPGDPGMVLLELFAHLTETMIYRLNRLPEKAYVEFLRLIGLRLQPPSAASVELRFSLNRPRDRPVEIPRGTRVTTSRTGAAGEAPVFVTSRNATIEPGQTTVDVPAYHCELIDGETAGIASGLPGFWVKVKRPPIVAPTGDDLDLVVGVSVPEGELGERVRAREHEGKSYRIWREVEDFTGIGADPYVYVAARWTGTIMFAPAAQIRGEGKDLKTVAEALAAVPPAGRDIRVWYRRGGGAEGNVPAHTLTVLKDPIAGVQVDNPLPATGGRPAETVQNAIIRGPHELHSLHRAVTARDFELLALRSSGAVARARAFTRARLWRHAQPGTVEVLLVPYVHEEKRGGGEITAGRLKELQTEAVRARIQQALDERRPLGTTSVVSWVRHKTVRVKARVVVHRGEDPAAVRARVVDRLHQTINPLPTALNPTGWRFGQPLRAFYVYDVIQPEPGVSYADGVRLLVDQVPERQVRSVSADWFQPRAWYASSGSTLFRSLDDGDGWEPAGDFPDEEVELVRGHRSQPGLVAVATRLSGEERTSRIHVSSDCGETWRAAAQMERIHVNDMAWTEREGVSILLLATDQGLYELAMQPDASVVQVLVDPANQKLGFYAVSVSATARGRVVALGARGAGGIYLSEESGKEGTFSHIGLKGEDVRVLAVQSYGVRSFLWAGVALAGNEAPKGCFRWELTNSAEGWRQILQGWTGGSCYGLAFLGSKIFAATHDSGVLWADSRKSDATWHSPLVGCGLPIRDVERIFHPVWGIAVDSEERLILAVGPEGVYRSRDQGVTYEQCSAREFSEKVTLPETWLFCSGEHEITVVSEDDARRD